MKLRVQRTGFAVVSVVSGEEAVVVKWERQRF